MDELYPPGFRPDHPEMLKGRDGSFMVPGTNLIFRRWTGEKMVNDFGGKPVVDYEGRPMFAELAVALMLIKAGWSARWVEVYYRDNGKPYYLLDWHDAKPFSQKSVALDSFYHLELMEKIEKCCLKRYDGPPSKRRAYRGAWDILAWKGERTLLMELKHVGKDAIIKNQFLWYIGAIDADLKRDNFLVIQWRFDDDPVPRRRQKTFKQPGTSVARVPKQVTLG